MKAFKGIGTGRLAKTAQKDRRNFRASKIIVIIIMKIIILRKKSMNSFFFYNELIFRRSFTDILKNRCSKKFRKLNKKTPVLESPFNKAAGPQACNFIKKRLQQGVFL